MRKIDKGWFLLFNMGMFDFFRKKEVVRENVEIGSFEEAVRIFEERVEVLREKERVVLSDVVERLDGFYVSVEGKLGVLDAVDIEGKKEYEKAKILVRQGLDKYVGLVRGLLKDLRGLRKESLGEFVGEVGRVFVGFEKGSCKVYERATYLVGDEMMAVRNEIRKFYNGLLKAFEGEKDLIVWLKKCDEVKGKVGEISRMEENLVGLDKEDRLNEDRVIGLKDRVVGLKGEVEGVEKSVEYVGYLKARDEVGVLSGRIEREVMKLKGMIDFKRLVGVVHSNEKELGAVKRFRDSFVSEFSSNGGGLVELLESSGMMSSEIEGQVDLVVGLKKELVEVKKKVGVDVVEEKLGEVGKIEREVEVKRIAGVKVRGRMKEVGIRLDGLKSEVVGLVEGLGESL